MRDDELKKFIEESKEVCDRATKGPWGHGIVGNGWGFVEMPTAKALCESNGQNVAPNMLWEDAQFVHHARAALPAALAELERLSALTQSGRRCDECTDHVVDGAEFRQLRKIREAAKAWANIGHTAIDGNATHADCSCCAAEEILKGRGPK